MFTDCGMGFMGGGLVPGTFIGIDGTNSFTTTDGINYLTASSVGSSMNSLCIGNGTIVAAQGSAAASSVGYISTDGLHWSTTTMSSSSQWNSCAWNGSVFCMISRTSETKAQTSTDGITWTAQTLPATAVWQSIAWNGTVFCAIANNGASGGTVAATSPDGVTWTSRTLSQAPGASGWGRLVWNWSKFVVIDTTVASTKMMTSLDGITWTNNTIVSASGEQFGVKICATHASGSFVISVNSSTTNTSADITASNPASTWTARTMSSSPTNGWVSICHNGSIYLACSATSTVNATSPDGTTWTSQTSPSSCQATELVAA